MKSIFNFKTLLILILTTAAACTPDMDDITQQEGSISDLDAYSPANEVRGNYTGHR